MVTDFPPSSITSQLPGWNSTRLCTPLCSAAPLGLSPVLSPERPCCPAALQPHTDLRVPPQLSSRSHRQHFYETSPLPAQTVPFCLSFSAVKYELGWQGRRRGKLCSYFPLEDVPRSSADLMFGKDKRPSSHFSFTEKAMISHGAHPTGCGGMGAGELSASQRGF